jgi:uncharacterized membrane protein
VPSPSPSSTSASSGSTTTQLFARLRNVDLGLIWINLLILATTALLPFPTGILAGAVSEGASGSREAAVILYAIVGALLSAAWIPVFPYLTRHPDLLLDPNDAGVLAKQKSRPLVRVGSYLLASVLGYCVSPLLALVVFVWMIAYHAITSAGLHANRLAQAFTRTRLFDEVTEPSRHEDVAPRSICLSRSSCSPWRPTASASRPPAYSFPASATSFCTGRSQTRTSGR